MRRLLRVVIVCAVAAMATALHADVLFPIYKNYQKAIAQGDAAGAKFYLSSGRRAELAKKTASEALAEMDVLSPKENLRLHDEILEDDDATLVVVASVADNESTGKIQFVREQGTWKILSEMWNLGGGPDDEPDSKVRQPENDAQREALRKLREIGYPYPEAGFLVGAAVDGNLEAAKLFIAAGYSPDTVENGTPAIVAAATFEQYAVMQYLIDAGANVNAVDDINMSALMRIADKCDATPAIRALLKAGARTDLKNDGGSDAAQFAEWGKCTENVKVLRAKR
ncbi:MAG TPA: ankyrin repeat domain-containing protein [Thermoanaerobaculia bacterium]